MIVRQYGGNIEGRRAARSYFWHKIKKFRNQAISELSNIALKKVAVRTGLEPVTPCVTGMYSNQLN